MKAVIMAGGEGSRLRPLTCDIPKPMVPVMNIPLMEHIIQLLKQHGITEIAVTLMYLPQKIKDYFGSGTNLGVNLHYFTENVPLGTAGSVKHAQTFLDETFVVISGDCLTNMNLTDAIEFHKRNAALATVVLSRVDVPLEYGVVITETDGRIKGFLEKPSWGEVFSDTVSTGTYIFDPRVLDFIKPNIAVDFSQQLFPKLLSKNENMFGYTISEYWCDIGDISAYIKAHHDILEGKLRLESNLKETTPGIWIGNGTTISKKANIQAPCIIGNHCRIESGVSIEGMTVIGNNNVIEEMTSIKRGIIWNNNYLETGVEIRGAVIGNKVNIKQNAFIFESAIIGDGCIVKEGAIVKPNVKIWPQKTIDTMALVDRNIIWASKQNRKIFGENGISGIINVDISPEFATRLGAAYGSVLKKGSKVVVSSLTSNSARMFKHAFISGLLSVGVEVFNVSSLLTPISRHAVGFLSVDGGIHIKICNDNPNKIGADFMDAKGAGISRVMERKIENAFFREDFNRCAGGDISRLNTITDFKNYYVRSIINDVEFTKIRHRKTFICVISPSEFVLSIVLPMLTDLGCKVISFHSNTSLETYAESIRSTGAEFAIYIDGNAETIILLDQDGKIIPEDMFLAFTSLIVCKTLENPRIVVPLTAPSVLENMAKIYGGSVIRTKSSSQAVMEQLLSQNLNRQRDYLTQYQLHYDALASAVKIIEYLATQEQEFSEALKEIPNFHLTKMNIFCPWEFKGKVMRSLITEQHSQKIELLDGVKFILNRGWVLVLPDADLPLFRVFSEAESIEVSQNNAQIYLNKIQQIVDVALPIPK